MEKKTSVEPKFVPRLLPWIIAAAALATYLFTLNPWLSSSNLGSISRISGWEWSPLLTGPAYFVLTYPLHWVSHQHLPLALNLFGAICGTLAVAQLARSVALLPYDRTHDMRLREHSQHAQLSLPLAWIPPVLAAIGCGLQLTFWEQSTCGSAEMFNLLVFSYAIRVLLEFRIYKNEQQLTRGAFLFAAAMTNDFAMIAFFPLFFGALVWIRGLAFFNFRFLARMCFWTLAGLSLYLVLPYIASHSTIDPTTFWEALKTNLVIQKHGLTDFPKQTAALLAITSIVPILLFSFRWSSQFGDNSPLGTALASLVYHFINLLLFAVCLWVLLDSPISPRQQGMGYTFLPLYYLAALNVGYFAGYFLLVFKQVPTERPAPITQATFYLSNALVIAVLIGLPAMLLGKNLPEIRIANGPISRQYTAALAAGLTGKGLLLSDDPFRLIMVRAWLERTGTENNLIPLSTRAMTSPAYHRFLKKNYPQIWTEEIEPGRTNRYYPNELLRQIIKLAGSNDIYYLHPSYGYYFESFYAEPHGLTFKLYLYPTNQLLPPPLSLAVVEENEKFWQSTSKEALPLIQSVVNATPPEAHTNWLDGVEKSLHIKEEPHRIPMTLAGYYSRSINLWGAQMQKIKQLDRAGECFQTALDLKSDNVVAMINLACNKKLHAGESPEVTADKTIEDLFSKYRSWDEIETLNGTYDEPTFCYADGYTFMRYQNYRQAALAFDRVQALSQKDVMSRILLAQIALTLRIPDQALDYANELQAHPDRFKLSTTNVNNLLCLEGSAHLLRGETETGIRTLDSAADSGLATGQPQILNSIATIYSSHKLYTNALAVLDRRLLITPDEPNTLIDKSYAFCQMKAYDKAIPVLTAVLNDSPTNAIALLNRAVAYLGNNQISESKADYEKLQELYPDAQQAYFGLATIALQNKDTNTAIQNFEAYLTNASPQSAESKFVRTRLKELQGESTAMATKQ